MKKALVGYTGFVGSNLMASGHFDAFYNSKNIEDAYETKPDLLVYAGVPAEMFLANSAPEKDLELMKNALRNIERINPKKLALISTVAVYSDITDGDENTVIDKEKLKPYGLNRLYLEEEAAKLVGNCHIVRLPALYGINIKKNFIYDYINYIPKLLKNAKYEELLSRDKRLSEYYVPQDNGFYRCRELKEEENKRLKAIFKSLGFSALNFTDSRNVYQFYNLKNLYHDLEIILKEDVRKINLVTEPLSVQEVYRYLEGKEFINEASKEPLRYNLKTVHGQLFGKDTYIKDKETVLSDIKDYVDSYKKD